MVKNFETMPYTLEFGQYHGAGLMVQDTNHKTTNNQRPTTNDQQRPATTNEKESTMAIRRTNVIDEISGCIEMVKRATLNNSPIWKQSAQERLKHLEDCLPSGSGIDCGTKIDIEASTQNKIVLFVEYHHMNDGGFYDGWTAHTITITPTFHSYEMKISGRNRNNIKDYLSDVYTCALSQAIDVDNSDNSITIPPNEYYLAQVNACGANGAGI